MTSKFPNDLSIQKKILSYLYRRKGKTVSINHLLLNVKTSSARVILSELVNVNGYAISFQDRHRQIGRTTDKFEYTLKNVEVELEITEKGIKHYRENWMNPYLRWLSKPSTIWTIVAFIFTAIISITIALYSKSSK